MELIVINENKLKIMMSDIEMKQYGLDENEFHCSMTNARKILDRILSKSPIYTGFEAHRENERILLQLFSARSGGCELFVTKLPLCEDYIIEEEANPMPSYNEDKRLLPTAKSRQSESKKITLAYKFEKLEYVKEACNALCGRGYEGESALYLSDEGKYFLFVKFESGKSEKSSPSSYLSEFGELQIAELSAMYVGEYGSCVYEKNAISKICEK